MKFWQLGMYQLWSVNMAGRVGVDCLWYPFFVVLPQAYNHSRFLTNQRLIPIWKSQVGRTGTNQTNSHAAGLAAMHTVCISGKAKNEQKLDVWIKEWEKHQNLPHICFCFWHCSMQIEVAFIYSCKIHGKLKQFSKLVGSMRMIMHMLTLQYVSGIIETWGYI